MKPTTTTTSTRLCWWCGGDGTRRLPASTSTSTNSTTFSACRKRKITSLVIVLILILAAVVSFNVFTLIVWHHRLQLHTNYEYDNDNNDKDKVNNSHKNPKYNGQNSDVSASKPLPLPLPPPPLSSSSSTCAILLFGLPRAFKQYVLPSFIENVVRPNLRYKCDYYMHYYADKIEGRSRSGHGGTVNPDDVWLLPRAILDVVAIESAASADADEDRHYDLPIVSFVNDTNTTFWEKRHDELMKFRNTKILDQDGNLTYKYFPWKEPTYVWPDTLDNMVRQWHSIERVWDHMMMSVVERRKNKNKSNEAGYDRVAMMRNDVVYIAPIDIYKIPDTVSSGTTSGAASARSLTKDESIRRAAFGGEGGSGRGVVVQKKKTLDSKVSMPTSALTPIYDYDNKYVVIPNWAKYPINDRYISGPFEAVKIWATRRFKLIDEYAAAMTRDAVPSTSTSSEFTVRFPPPEVGRVMHSESFLNATVMNIVRNQLQYHVVEDNWVCFLRVRADGAIWIDDCHGSMLGFGGDEEGGGEAAAPGFPGDVMEYVQPFLPPGTSCRKRRLRDKVRIVMELVCKPTGGRGPAVIIATGQTRRMGFPKSKISK